jgi:hypothetical protein
MPMARRLMNKKTFEEMELLETRCAVENKKGKDYYAPLLELNGDVEYFSIYIYENRGQDGKPNPILWLPATLKEVLLGRNYTSVEKQFTRYVNGK